MPIIKMIRSQIMINYYEKRTIVYEDTEPFSSTLGNQYGFIHPYQCEYILPYQKEAIKMNNKEERSSI